MMKSGRGWPWRLWLKRSLRVALALLALGFMMNTRNFFTPGTMGTILMLGSIVGVLAVGQAFVLIGGGFDLSQGAAMALSAATAAWLANDKHLPAIAAPAALLLGAILGAVNGVFVALVGTNPFVTTLSTQMLYRGAAFALLGGLSISGVRAFDMLEQGPTVGGTPLPARDFLFLGVAAMSWFVLSKTVFGRHVYAVGGNVRAARLSGIPTSRLRIMTFALSGMAAALAALMQLSWVRVAKADTGAGMELNSIAACVVGGIALGGGSGSVAGAACGCLLLQALDTCLTMNRFPAEYHNLATGAVILTFAAVDALAGRSS